MAVTTRTGRKTRAMGAVDEKAIVAALRKLPPDTLPDVLRYIEFLDYKINVARSDAAEEAALWAEVEANQEYKRQHLDEEPEVYETGADFLKAVAN
jgi:hypothetical protein